MARVINDNLQNNSPKSLDNKYTKFVSGVATPYSSISEVNTTILSAYRSRGLTVLISIDGKDKEYWYYTGILDSDLKEKVISAPLFALFEDQFYEDGTVIPDGYTDPVPLIKINPDLFSPGGVTPDLQTVLDEGNTASGTNAKITLTGSGGYVWVTPNSSIVDSGVAIGSNGIGTQFVNFRYPSTEDISPTLLNAPYASTDNELNLPNASGILVVSINGESADINGNVVITGSGGIPTLADVVEQGDTTEQQIYVGGLHISEPDIPGAYGVILATDGTVKVFKPNSSDFIDLFDLPSGGTVSSVGALTIGTSGTNISSTVANSTTTPVITLNIPSSSASNRGVLTSADWTTFNNKISSQWLNSGSNIYYSAGRVGIGTSSFTGSALFQVNGISEFLGVLNIRSTPFYQGAVIKLYQDTSGSSSSFFSGILLYNNLSEQGSVLMNGSTTGGGLSGWLSLAGPSSTGVAITTATSSPALKIFGTTGNVVIGSDNDSSAKLQVTNSITHGSGTSIDVVFEIAPTINNSGTYSGGLLRGIYYHPTLTSLTGTTHRFIEAATGDVCLNTTSGNTIIGSTTDNGSKLQVNGSITGVTEGTSENSIKMASTAWVRTYVTGGAGSSSVQFASTKSAANALTLSAGTWVRVAADETNNGDKSMYLYVGSSLEFHYTIP